MRQRLVLWASSARRLPVTLSVRRGHLPRPPQVAMQSEGCNWLWKAFWALLLLSEDLLRRSHITNAAPTRVHPRASAPKPLCHPPPARVRCRRRDLAHRRRCRLPDARHVVPEVL